MNRASRQVCILLPVYNGAAFLARQLDSLLEQTHDAWHCLIRDDGSSDGSIGVIDGFCARHPGRFRRIEDDRGNLGVVGCLNAIGAHVRAPYFAPCDQDDVWKPHKLQACLREIRGIEDDGAVAALVVSDLAVVDAALAPVDPSFWRRSGNLEHVDDLNCLPVFNAFAGCTMLGNAALFRLAFPVPAQAPMHDHWIALAARYGGRARVLHEPLVLYRQHGGNQCGVPDSSSVWRRAARHLTRVPDFFERGRRLRKARLAMLTVLSERLEAVHRCEDYERAVAAEKGSPLARLAFLRRHGIPPAKAITYWLT